MIKEVSFSYKIFSSINDLSEEDKILMLEAENALEKAYAKYSGFNVGASLYLDNGEMMSANNQENMALPSSLCAERVLLYYFKANFPLANVKKMAISVKSSIEVIDEPISPCGSCRQVMLEYERMQEDNIEILLKGETGKVYLINSVSDLLPLAFNTNAINHH